MNDSKASPTTRPRRLPAWMIPVAIALGFGLLFLALFRDRLLPAADVRIAPVLATVGESTTVSTPASEAAMAFQASGWVEPDPLPIKATALTDGVIDEVHVLEGQAVKKDQPLASLIQDDTSLAVDAAKAALETARSELRSHRATHTSLERQLNAAEASSEATSTSVEETADRARRIDGLSPGAMAEADLIAIRSAHAKAQAEQNASLAAVQEAEANLISHQARLEVLESQVTTAEVALKLAELAHSRTRILSPTDGRVLRLLAAPGQKKMLGMDDPDSATVAILYQPDHLQVRVDVPLADAAGLQVGQRARILCSLLPDQVFHGEVTRITGEADLQRNTLQAKVRIEDPSDLLRPEMLCRVEFLQAARESSGETTTSTILVTWIPQAALQEDHVWVFDPDSSRVSRRPVTPGGESRDGHVRIDAGLRPGERVVVSPPNLHENQRVQPTDS